MVIHMALVVALIKSANVIVSLLSVQQQKLDVLVKEEIYSC